eukprot:792751-Prorocentrum_minimum.AAC.1
MIMYWYAIPVTPRSPIPVTPQSPIPVTPRSPLPVTPRSPIPVTPRSPIPVTPRSLIPVTPRSPIPGPTIVTPATNGIAHVRRVCKLGRTHTCGFDFGWLHPPGATLSGSDLCALRSFSPSPNP